MTIFALLPLLLNQKSTIEVISIMLTFVICQLFGFLLSKNIKQQYLIIDELGDNDPLTGALNKRALDDRLKFLHNISARHKYGGVESTASLILFDIDDFKAISEEFGQQEGEQILKNVTHLFKDTMRNIDQIYRSEGEEFVLIANGADALKAVEFAEKMRILMESTKISEFPL